jgi:hypothetical protein
MEVVLSIIVCAAQADIHSTLLKNIFYYATILVEFYYDPYDWSFPPDLIIRGNMIKPSLQDIGLDDSWDQKDPSCLSNTLGKLSRMMQASRLFPFFS